MLYHTLLKGLHFLSYTTQKWKAYATGNLQTIKNRKNKHADNKDKTRSVVLKRQPKGLLNLRGP